MDERSPGEDGRTAADGRGGGAGRDRGGSRPSPPGIQPGGRTGTRGGGRRRPGRIPEDMWTGGGRESCRRPFLPQGGVKSEGRGPTSSPRGGDCGERGTHRESEDDLLPDPFRA
ncbi:hypothetical protein THAOC_05025 [Thalassiosira oceanica]|uniref:Uncharacterized protein n=1 Tax=Thalassiosira oceanica TaxID=159749 RepID=K0THY6_THAOC|nr:hypothetical protein THAOC_05025 [Thalassiosira oceanica]|eukprot:EJK73356.1 hypothetical protein THAOC_05025 [Thalassiosira oceanica]